MSLAKYTVTFYDNELECNSNGESNESTVKIER